MPAEMIYLDNHATTRVDDRVVAAMLPFLTDVYANAGSVSHAAGQRAADAVTEALEDFARRIHADREELVITSGSTEAANLAIFGYCTHPLQKRRKIVSVRTEHQAVLDPLARLAESGFEVAWLPVRPQGHADAGRVDLDAAREIIDERTAIVCTMWVNNEIGVVQPIRQISGLCDETGAALFCDATAGFGRLKVDRGALAADYLAFSAHKFYGPKGIGGLVYRAANSKARRIRPQILGGGQQNNLRSGTLNVAGIIAMAEAYRVCDEVRGEERPRIARLRAKLWQRLQEETDGAVVLNGPTLDGPVDEFRVAENLNVRWPGVEGQTLMLNTPTLCFSSGSACSSARQGVSHVLLNIGLSEDEARCSTRFGLGRFTTEEEIDEAASILGAAYRRLRIA